MRFDNQAIDGQVCSVKPYMNRSNNAVIDDDDARRSKSILDRRVYLMNLPYKATNSEIEDLVKQVTNVNLDQVVIPRDR